MKVKFEVELDLENNTYDVKSKDGIIEHSGSSYLRFKSPHLYGSIGSYIPDLLEEKSKSEDLFYLHFHIGKIKR